MAEKTPDNPRGAGRNKLDASLKKRPFSVKLPVWIIEKLKAEPGSQAQLIEKALIAFFKWDRN
jgi:hypothetical protein